MRRSALFLLPLLVLALLSARPLWRGEPSQAAGPAPALDPRIALAIAAVEAWMGPFENEVLVEPLLHRVEPLAGGRCLTKIEDEHLLVPGMGLAHIAGFAELEDGRPVARAEGLDPRTLIHELVHVRLCEEGARLPLWFEEGLASLLADGAIVEGRFVRDGFACWPWMNLLAARPGPLELAALLVRDPAAEVDLRENLLAHQVGWALCFDLWRETRSEDWRIWLDRFNWKDPTGDAGRRLARVLDPKTPSSWLRERLASPRREVRLAALPGTWKLAAPTVSATLLASLGLEEDSEVRAGLAVNLWARPAELFPSEEAAQRAQALAEGALRRADLENPLETACAWLLSGASQARGRPLEAALSGLERFWRE